LNSYKTILKPSVSEPLKIRKSKFIGFAFPVNSQEEVDDALSLLRVKYNGASHWCFAYKYGIVNEFIRTNDDGEPNNSAGKPILGQIEAFDLSNVLVVVVRYYGGTKLGVGGLISAYKETAMKVLSNSKLIKKELTKTISLEFKYQLLNTAMRLVKQYNLTIIKQEMEMNCVLTLKVPNKIFEEVKERCVSIYELKFSVL
jgi:uncharacterized YigZ family protein